MAPRPHRQEPGFVRTFCGDFGGMRALVHTDKNPVSSGPAVEDSGGPGLASTLTRTRSPQDPLWRIQRDVVPRPHGKEPGLHRTHGGGFRGTWPRVHTDKNPVSSGPAVEDSGARGPASTRTRTRSPQVPPREEQVRRKPGPGKRSFRNLEAEGGGVPQTLGGKDPARRRAR